MPTKSYSLAYARASLDGGDEVEESQHGTLPQASVGLEGLDHLIHSPNLIRIELRSTRFHSLVQYLGSCAGIRLRTGSDFIFPMGVTIVVRA